LIQYRAIASNDCFVFTKIPQIYSIICGPAHASGYIRQNFHLL
jgi:hypothetical protein